MKNCTEAEIRTTTKEPGSLLQGRTSQALRKDCVYPVDKKWGGVVFLKRDGVAQCSGGEAGEAVGPGRIVYSWEFGF